MKQFKDRVDFMVWSLLNRQIHKDIMGLLKIIYMVFRLTTYPYFLEDDFA